MWVLGAGHLLGLAEFHAQLAAVCMSSMVGICGYGYIVLLLLLLGMMTQASLQTSRCTLNNTLLTVPLS